jgi:2-hydroxychromene-2-carboxylate isomerase
MSAPVIDFWFDFGSPNAWLAHAVLPDIAERAGAQLVWRPMLLGGVFKATGNQSPMQAFGHLPAKLAWMEQARQRFCEVYGVPYGGNAHFPVNTLKLMRGAVWVRDALGEDGFARYVDAMFRCMWIDGRKMDDDAVLVEALGEHGFEADAFLEGIQRPEVKQGLVEATETAVAAGVFGAPSCVVGDQLFFGKDDIVLMEAWLRREAGRG